MCSIRIFSFLIGLFGSLSALTWQTPGVTISNPLYPASENQVVMNDQGQAIAIWRGSDGSHFRIQVSRYSFTLNSWGAPEMLSAAGFDASVPQIALNQGGQAIAVWVFNTGFTDVIQTATLASFNSSWSPAFALTDDDGFNAEDPEITLNNLGHAIATWLKFDSGFLRFEVQTRNFAFPSGPWSLVAPIPTGAAVDSPPHVLINNLDQAIATWTWDIGSFPRLMLATLTSFGGVWSDFEIQLIPPGDFGKFDPQIALNDSGEVEVIWRQIDTVSITSVIRTVSYSFSAGALSMAQFLSDSATDAQSPMIVLNNLSQAMAIWTRFDDNSPFNPIVQTNRILTFGTLWPIMGSWPLEVPAPVNLSLSTSPAFTPQIAFNNQEEGVALWVSFIGGTNVIQSTSLPFATSLWDVPVTITSSSHNSITPRFVLGDTGRAVATWQSDSVIQATVTSFLLSPLNLKGKQEKNLFTDQDEYLNELSWQASLSPNVQLYRLYKDGLFLAMVLSGQPLEFEDRAQKEDSPHIYSVTAVDTKGQESLPILVTVPP